MRIHAMTQTLLEQWVRRSSQRRDHEMQLSSYAIREEKPVTSSNGCQDHARTTPSMTARPSSLPSNVVFTAPEKEHITKLKRLNSLLLPIPYPDSFYKEIQDDAQAQRLTLLAFWQDSTASTSSSKQKGQLIGAVRCRLLEDEEASSNNGPILYLSTLVLLSPYRGLGVASHMLDILISRGIEDYGVKTIGAHVWDANEAALEWYKKRGFTETGHIPDYYRKLNPQGAKIMSRKLSVLDLTGD